MSTRSSREPIETVRHQLRPLFDQVVLKELDQDRMRRSGLVVPQGIDEPPPQQGIVLAVGPGLDWWESAGVDMPVQPGDHVVFPSSAGVWVEIDEERLLVCRVGEILGVLESLETEPARAPRAPRRPPARLSARRRPCSRTSSRRSRLRPSECA